MVADLSGAEVRARLRQRTTFSHRAIEMMVAYRDDPDVRTAIAEVLEGKHDR